MERFLEKLGDCTYNVLWCIGAVICGAVFMVSLPLYIPLAAVYAFATVSGAPWKK